MYILSTLVGSDCTWVNGFVYLYSKQSRQEELSEGNQSGMILELPRCWATAPGTFAKKQTPERGGLYGYYLRRRSSIF